MKTVIAFALGTLVGAPLLAVATDGWIPAKLTWTRPTIPESGEPKATMGAELPAGGQLLFETNGSIDSYYVLAGEDRACSVTVPTNTSFKMLTLSAKGDVSYALNRPGGKPATIDYSGATALPAPPKNLDSNPYNVSATVTQAAAAVSQGSSERRISPRPLAGMETLRCASDTIAAAGVWRSAGGYVESVGEERQSNPTTWRIVIADDQAVVSRVDGVSGAAVDPEIWNVGRTRLGGMDRGVGLVLTPRSRSASVSPEAITIDEKTSSFVYTTQHVNFSYNRATVFYGTCTGR